ncbi:MAG TPA: 5'-methylthioadenosine/S-adenosylhomocysteine nucleosidase [Vicinamibacterales bacterium]|nr:5'-methylthioadenosine/S-adenosylhomocysteine nucleosidase [Vicinamibacterales bacterium]
MNSKRAWSMFAALAAAALVTACGTRDGAGPVVVQGAMDVEIRKLAGSLEHGSEEHVGGWIFWRGTIDGYPVVVSKTLKGMENAAAATALAADRFHPIAIINQGTAGGHVPELHVYDIVLGRQAVNLGSFKTGYRASGRGSDVAEWNPLDLMRSEGSAGQDPSARTIRRFPGDEGLLTAAREVRARYQKGHVVEGVIGSSEVWNSELDRIQRFHDQYGTTVEEMEAASAAQISGLFTIPFLGIRVVSNNITNGEAYDTKVGEACQDFVREVVKAYIRVAARKR